jgi:ZIP family zinc transporter
MFSDTYVSIILLASLSFFSTLIGVGLAFYFKKSANGIAFGIGFSAGIMLLVSFFELIPESIYEIGFSNTSLAVGLGIFFIAILNLVIPHSHLLKGENKNNKKMIKAAYLIVFGLILHDFPEGFAMATSYIYDPSLGLFLALAIALHNIPEEFAMAVPLLLANKKRLVIQAAILSALAEPVGAILGLLAVSLFSDLEPFFMAFAAGAMIFISLHELLPMAKKYKRIFLFFLGALLSVIVYIGLGLLILV